MQGRLDHLARGRRGISPEGAATQYCQPVQIQSIDQSHTYMSESKKRLLPAK